MDRTTARRIFNEFTSEIDLNSPDGLLRSSDVDRYIEQALKPLIEEGRAFKRVSVNRRTGIRSTRYAYQGGRNIQDSINAILSQMPADLGYDVDPATGNVRGTNRPPPMAIVSQGRHYYNETRERILDPRTAASIKAQALRAGGASITDKASGYTTTLVRAGLSGETRAMRGLVNETDQRYLAGLLPSSALADGASPATIEERARAQVARQANIKDARRAAIEDFIRANPASQLAIEEAAKLQRVTNREEKARLLEAERTPGTLEFQAAAERRLNRNAARDKAEEAWARKNKRDPLAKAILKRNRSRTAGGRALNRAMAAMRFGAIGVVLGAISIAVKTMVGFLSGLPALVENVRRISNKGASLGVTNKHLVDLEALESRLPGLEKGAIGNYLGSMHNNLADVATGGALTEVIGDIAPLLSKASGGADLARRIAYYSAGQDVDTNALGKDLLNAMLAVSVQGRTLYKDDLKPSDALRFNAVTFGRALGGDKIMNSFAAALQNKELIPDAVLQQIINVANGKREEINGQAVAGGMALEAIIAAIMGKQDMLKPSDTATAVEWKAADEIAERWKDLAATFQEIKTGILVSIASTLGGILSLVEYIAKAVLTLPIFGDRFSPIVQGLDERAYYRNIERVKSLEILHESANQYANALGEKHGFLKTKKLGEDKESGYLIVQSPDGRVSLMSERTYEATRRDELAHLEKKFWANGENVPREFVGKYDEYMAFMAALGVARITGNELNFGRAQNEGFENMGTPVEYEEINNSGKAVKKIYEGYKVGNVRELKYATPSQAAAQVQKDMYSAIGASNADIKNLEGRDDNWWDWLVSGANDWYFRALEESDAKGEDIDPATYSRLERWRNEKARYEWLANDGMQIGNPRPEGQADRSIAGEASVLAGRAVRRSTSELAQWQTEIEAIRAQAGILAYRGVLEGSITVQGTIKTEDRTYTIILQDAKTGENVGSVQDVQNVSGEYVMSGLRAAREAFSSPTVRR